MLRAVAAHSFDPTSNQQPPAQMNVQLTCLARLIELDSDVVLNAISTTSDRKDSMEPLFEMASGIKSTDISEDNYVVLGNLFSI